MFSSLSLRSISAVVDAFKELTVQDDVSALGKPLLGRQDLVANATPTEWLIRVVSLDFVSSCLRDES